MGALLPPLVVAGAALLSPRIEAASDPPGLPPVTVFGGRAGDPGDSALSWLRDAQSSSELDRDALDRWQPARLEDLTGLLPGTVVDTLNAGLSTAVKVRGFALTRLHYNGVPDVQRMYNRDLFTVERIEVLRGPAAALMGITSPGGVVHYIGKRASDKPHAEFGAAAGNDSFVRLTLDGTGPLGGPDSLFRYRALGAVEQGRMSWADLPVRRRQGMVVVERRYGDGVVGVDLQEQRNHTPFTFGTVITNEGTSGSPAQDANVAWDRLLVLDGGAPTMRRYHESRAWWDHKLGDDWRMRVSLGQAVVTRDETLIGFWTITSPTTVSSYYTQYHDSYRQRTARVEASASLVTTAVRHDLRFGLDRYRQRFHFEGVQNIGGASIDIDNPDFSAIDPARLELTPRYNDERVEEDGAWVADKLTFGLPLSLLLAARQQQYQIESDRTGAGRRSVADASKTTAFAGLSLPIAAAWRAWASWASGMEPNRGSTRDGGFLPPQQSRQQEAGIERSVSENARASLALWQIDLRHLPMTDPDDRTAVISSGHRKVEGVETLVQAAGEHWSLQSNLSFQRTRQVVRTSPDLGDRFVGLPNASGGLQFQRQVQLVNSRAQVWIGLVAVGSRMGDAANTVRVPGYVRVDAGASVAVGGVLLQLGVRNAGDIRYVESVTAADNVYQGPRRQWWAGLRVRL